MNASDTHTPNASNGGRIALYVAGAAVALLAAVTLVAGFALVGADRTQRDADGFYATGTSALATPTRAFVSENLDVGTDGPDWLFRHGRLGTVRVTATGTAARPVFVGIARKAQVDAYVRGVAHDEVTDFDVDPLTVTTARHAGTLAPPAPATRHIWAASASGAGRQTLKWPVAKGDWSVVVMNADGSLGVDTAVSVGARLGFVLRLALVLVAAGGILAVLAAALFASGVRWTPPGAPASLTPSPAS